MVSVRVLIREATLEDAEALRDYAGRLFAERLPGIFRRDKPTIEQEMDFLNAYLTQENSTLLVAERDGVIVGNIGFMGEKLAEEAHTGTFGISVAKDARGSGIGTALIGALMAWAPLHGITRIQLLAWTNNPGSIRLYERLGFEREGVLRRAVITEGATIDVLLLAKLLD